MPPRTKKIPDVASAHADGRWDSARHPLRGYDKSIQADPWAGERSK